MNDSTELLIRTDDDAEKIYQQYKDLDPYTDIDPSLLNSADILAYVKKTALIHPFDVNCLKGASYDVKICGEVVYWDEKGEKQSKMLTKAGEWFDLCPNSIAFVTVEPTFRIPNYMALRFNLKISHIYKGLLLGTGPLVDPGFVGKLSIPLHNLTSNIYRFFAFDELITMEFTKMSSNKLWNAKAPDIAEEYIKNEIRSNRTVSDYISKALRNDRLGKVISSIPDAMLESQKKVTAAQKEVKKVKRTTSIQVGVSIVAVCGLIISCIGFSLNALNKANDRYDALFQEYANITTVYDEKITALQNEINTLSKLISTNDEIQNSVTTVIYEETSAPDKTTLLEKTGNPPL